MMGSEEAYMQIVMRVSGMDRRTLTDELLHFDGDVQLDFTPEYLADCGTDRLQHILVAALWRSYIKQLSTGLATHVCA